MVGPRGPLAGRLGSAAAVASLLVGLLIGFTSGIAGASELASVNAPVLNGWRARFDQYRANRSLAQRAIALATTWRASGAPAIEKAHEARLHALKMQKWGLAAPATASALSIASHALLPGVYWFW